jgi:L-2,4-diaminobutyrate decarboxylase
MSLISLDIKPKDNWMPSPFSSSPSPDSAYLDPAFLPHSDLEEAIVLLNQTWTGELPNLPDRCPEEGMGELAALRQLAPHVLGRGARLDGDKILAHMDPPTPWITWVMAFWNARLNQNLLHPSTAPFAREAEQRVLDWLTPFFGMKGGHFCSGATLANLTALWAARDAYGVKRVIASESAHFSIPKAAQILGLPYVAIPTNAQGQLDVSYLHSERFDPAQLAEACLVLTAGTTATGAIDPLDPLHYPTSAQWIHVDAAWAGPLRLSPTFAPLLHGIENANSVTISAHKWFFQPKESALILFREPAIAHEALSFGGSYLATDNIGLQGSRGAAAIPLLATLLAWGRTGMVDRIERAMGLAQTLANALDQNDRFELWGQPLTGITVFRPLQEKTEDFYDRLSPGMLSTCVLDQQTWLRSVAANPLADVSQILEILDSERNS